MARSRNGQHASSRHRSAAKRIQTPQLPRDLRASQPEVRTASSAAIRTVHRWLPRAPHATRAAAKTMRNDSGSQPEGSCPLVRNSTQAAHWFGNSSQVMVTRAPVAPNAMNSELHSRRTANHSKAIPGVTFVKIAKHQAQGCRNPMTTRRQLRCQDWIMGMGPCWQLKCHAFLVLQRQGSGLLHALEQVRALVAHVVHLGRDGAHLQHIVGCRLQE